MRKESGDGEGVRKDGETSDGAWGSDGTDEG